MGKSSTMVFLIYLLLNLVSLSPCVVAISSCDGPCQTLDDCDGQLICINGGCSDDPNLGTNICQGTTSSPDQSNGCQQSGTLSCNGNEYPTYECSPTITSSTPAILTNNDFSEGGDGGDPSKCDEQFHSNDELIVALSTGWFSGGTRCNQMISIQATNGNSVKAKVVDECDSMHGCDKAHAGQRPCDNNIVDASNAVWKALGLNTDDGRVDITWSTA